MVFLTKTSVSKLKAAEAREEALRYSNLCKVQGEVIAKYEKQLSAMSTELGSQHQLVLSAQAHLEQMKDALFGRSSERQKGNSGLPLLDSNEPETQTITYQKEKKKRTEFGRTPLPELPKVEIKHELSAEEQLEQGLEPIEGQFETSEQVNVVPGRYQQEIHLRQKYREKEKSPAFLEKLEKDPDASPGIVTAPGPLKLKDGNKYSIDFGIDTGLNKYSFHMPLERQARQMKDFGLTCTSQVLFAQTDTIAWYLENHVIPAIAEKIHGKPRQPSR